MKRIFIIITLLFNSCINENELPEKINSQVVAIQDGDTIELRYIFNGKAAAKRKNKNLRIRLAHINCNERGEPYYKKAKKFTSDLCFRENVTIIHDEEFDKYGRLIGEVILQNGKVLNKELVKAGLAFHYKKYSNSPEYAAIEKKARELNLGIWHFENLKESLPE